MVINVDKEEETQRGQGRGEEGRERQADGRDRGAERQRGKEETRDRGRETERHEESGGQRVCAQKGSIRGKWQADCRATVPLFRQAQFPLLVHTGRPGAHTDTLPGPRHACGTPGASSKRSRQGKKDTRPTPTLSSLCLSVSPFLCLLPLCFCCRAPLVPRCLARAACACAHAATACCTWALCALRSAGRQLQHGAPVGA